MSRNDKRLKKSDGFSLVELLAVITIMGILLGMAVISGHNWVVGSQVENQTRQIFTDLMSARMNAMQKNKAYFVTLAANQYAVYEDTNPPEGDGQLQTAQDTRLLQKNITYALNSSTTISFSSCGLSSVASDESYTIHVNSTAAPSFDCIVLRPTRLLMGKWNGTDCTLQ